MNKKKKKKLYLDFNILIYLKDKKDDTLNIAIQNLLSKNYHIIYSPAHIEEIAVTQQRDNQPIDKINKDLDFISDITNNNALRPVSSDHCILYSEPPKDCFERVIKDYSRNDLAESIEYLSLQDAHINSISEPKEMNNIPPEEIFKDIKHKREILKMLVANEIILKKDVKKALKWDFNSIRSKFYIFEAYIDLSSKYLEKLGFFRENIKKSRSKLHDVSHIIYSAYCDIFITNDKKLYNKTKAIYSLLKINTKIYMKDEFIKEYSTNSII